MSRNFGRTPLAELADDLPLGIETLLLETKMSCITTTSPSMPVTSDTLTIFRAPSLRRATWMMTFSAALTCSRIALAGSFESCHQDHGFEAGEGVPRRIGVDGGDGAVVAGIHRLEHVQRLAPAHLAQDDPVGTHPEGVAHQVPLGHVPLPSILGGGFRASPHAPAGG